LAAFNPADRVSSGLLFLFLLLEVPLLPPVMPGLYTIVSLAQFATQFKIAKNAGAAHA
jgi:hypothetical protein